jgi:hypothetical protein
MTDEQILELAKTCGFDDMIGERDDGTYSDYWECWEDQLLKFAQEIRKQTIDEVLTLIKDVPNPEANWAAINLILNKYYD